LPFSETPADRRIETMPATVNANASSGSGLLRQRVDEFVGLFFYGSMLKGAREHPMTHAKFGMGGRGENVFGAQLDQELAQRAGQASNNSLSEAIVRRLAGKSAGQMLPGKNLMSGMPSVADTIGQRLDVKR
jgi:hypothetical protein